MCITTCGYYNTNDSHLNEPVLRSEPYCLWYYPFNMFAVLGVFGWISLLTIVLCCHFFNYEVLSIRYLAYHCFGIGQWELFNNNVAFIHENMLNIVSNRLVYAFSPDIIESTTREDLKVNINSEILDNLYPTYQIHLILTFILDFIMAFILISLVAYRKFIYAWYRYSFFRFIRLFLIYFSISITLIIIVTIFNKYCQ